MFYVTCKVSCGSKHLVLVNSLVAGVASLTIASLLRTICATCKAISVARKKIEDPSCAALLPSVAKQ